MKIGIVIIATNAYFPLGIRFMKKFMHHYKGNSQIEFHFFSDTPPIEYLPDNFPVKFYQTKHRSWVDGTNSKFKNILSVDTDCSHLFYLDADTNISKDFTEEWFIGDVVGGEHYGNRTYMLKNGIPYDRNPQSKAYIPYNTVRPQMYYYGAFFGGTIGNMKNFCQTLLEWQLEDKKINYEPGVNDESYINRYFHYNPPTKVVPSDKFEFGISDKGGMQETRNTRLNVDAFKQEMLSLKDKVFDIRYNKIVLI